VFCSSVAFALVILTFVWPFIAQGHGKYNATQDPTGGPGVGKSLCTRAYRPGVANDVFNGMEAIASYRLATSHACVMRHRVVGAPGAIAIHRDWAAGWRYTIAACYEWPADRRCPVVVL
jgi:hypothetical protein